MSVSSWEPPDFGDGNNVSPLRKFVVSGDKRQQDIDQIVFAEGNVSGLVMRARNVFIAARARDDLRSATEWAIIGVALAGALHEDTSRYD